MRNQINETPHAEEVRRASVYAKWKPSRLSDEAGTKAETSEQNTSSLSDGEGPYAKARK